MRTLGILFLVALASISVAQVTKTETSTPGDKAAKISDAAFAFAASVAPKGTPEYTAALRKALALGDDLPVSAEASRSYSLLTSPRGLLDLDVRYRDNFTNSQVNVRIWGGEPVPDGLHPDTVAITGNGRLCTGTLIAANTVLTAAHCFCGGVSEQVYVGQGINKPTATAKVGGGKAMIQCTDDLKNGDVAVLFLSTPLNVSPRSFANSTLINSATVARAVGFGATANPITEPVGIKRRVDVPVASTSCSGNVTTSDGKFPDSAFYGCAAGQELVAGAPSLDKDSCNGDSGGPLFVEGKDGNLYLAATTSRATGPPGLRPCGDGGIYVRTDGSVIDWIHSIGVSVKVGSSL
jgi:secreted trypsin-like serine protease